MTIRPGPTMKQRLASGGVTLGSWLSLGYSPVCEMMARAGFEWLVVDMEHTAISVDQQLQLIQVVELSGLAPLVRVGDNNPLLIKQAMDAGAHGVVVPMVNSPDEAEQAVAAAYYPPKGTRGVGLSRAQGYGLTFDEYRKRMADETVIVVQIEHIRAVERLREIVEVPGVDAFIVGPYDLSGSLGLPGKWDTPPVLEALEEVNRVVAEGRVPAGFHVVHSDHDELRRRVDEGYRMIAYGDDMVFLAEKLRDEVTAARGVLKDRQ